MNFDGNFTPNPQPLEFQTICQEVKNEFEDSGTGFRIPNPQEDPELIEELESLLPFDSPSQENNSQILDLSQSMNSQFFDTTQFAGLLEPMVELGEPRYTVQTEPFFNIFQDHVNPDSQQNSWQLGQISPAYSNGASPLYNPEPFLVVNHDPLGLTPPYEATNAGESGNFQILPVTTNEIVYQNFDEFTVQNCQKSQVGEFTAQNCQNSQVDEFTVQ
eukprot:00546.XXX_1415_753_1 [CDS] Oithona nana genome sequencing.